jgi:hypothetical protein
LTDIPDGFPVQIPPTPLKDETLEDLPLMIQGDQITEEARDWWKTWLKDKPLPVSIVPEGTSCAQNFLTFHFRNLERSLAD